MTSLCRDCQTEVTETGASRCPACRSPRILTHDELQSLSIAHIDCDAFYASVEKRDNPDLRDKPVIIGGGQRGVVSTACYIARTYGIRSAMPMFKARALCPQAVIVKPNMEKYATVGREVRTMMRDVTPLVEPVSIDEAFLDLSGTERLHGRSPAQTLIDLQHRIERDVGITVSVGLAANKFLAKFASDQDKPRGFFIIGEAEKADFLASQPVSKIWGVGKSLNDRLKRDGITKISQLQKKDQKDLIERYGSMGDRLYHLSRGLDTRRVTPSGEAKSISGETTFMVDIASYDDLEPILWRQCERVSARAKKAGLAGKTITLKLKTKRFRSRTRSRSLHNPTQLADVLFQVGRDLLAKECDGTEFRLLGIGLSHLVDAEFADPPDLIDQDGSRRATAERAVDALRSKFGSEAVQKGRALRPRPRSGKKPLQDKAVEKKD